MKQALQRAGASPLAAICLPPPYADAVLQQPDRYLIQIMPFTVFCAWRGNRKDLAFKSSIIKLNYGESYEPHFPYF